MAASWDTYLHRIYPDNYQQQLAQEIELLSKTGKNIIVGLKIPRLRNYDRKCYIKSMKIPYLNCEQHSKMLDKGDIAINKHIVAVAAKYPNVSTFAVRDFICDGQHCSAYIDNTPIYFDNWHLSMLGSELIGKLAIEQNRIPNALRQAFH